MNEQDKNKKAIGGIYEELKGIVASIKDVKDSFTDDGFSEKTNNTIKRVGVLCPDIEDISHYFIKTKIYSPYGGNVQYVEVIPTVVSLNSLIGRLKGEYDFDTQYKNEGFNIVQNQHQTQSQTITLVMELHERILNQIQNHKEGTVERGFLEKLKATLPNSSDVLSIFASILSIGSEYNLDIEKIKTLLGL